MQTDYSKILGFTPVAPQPDTDELAAKGSRLVLLVSKNARHDMAAGCTIGDNAIVVAPVGVLCSGWVIGVA